MGNTKSASPEDVIRSAKKLGFDLDKVGGEGAAKILAGMLSAIRDEINKASAIGKEYKIPQPMLSFIMKMVLVRVLDAIQKTDDKMGIGDKSPTVKEIMGFGETLDGLKKKYGKNMQIRSIDVLKDGVPYDELVKDIQSD